MRPSGLSLRILGDRSLLLEIFSLFISEDSLLVCWGNCVRNRCSAAAPALEHAGEYAEGADMIVLGCTISRSRSLI